MKKLFLMAFVATLSIATASAQFEKGVKTVNMKVSGFDLKYLSGDGYSASDLNIAAEASYFVIDRLSILAETGIESTKNVDYDEGVSTFHIGGGARYYFSSKGFFGGARLVGYVDGDEGLHKVAGKIEGGYTWYILDNFYIEPSLRIAKEYFTEISETSKETKLRIMVGVGIKF
jgi:hypothetical protein